MAQAVNSGLNRAPQDLKEMADKRGLALRSGNLPKDLTVTLLNKDEQSAFRNGAEEFPRSTPRCPSGTAVWSCPAPDPKGWTSCGAPVPESGFRNRIDQFGVTEPIIVRQGNEQSMRLPLFKPPGRPWLIGQAAQQFR
jgi:SecD/SecF fusion protein